MTICFPAQKRINSSRYTLAFVALAFIATYANQTQAGFISNDVGQIAVKISEKIEGIVDPEDMDLIKGAMWDLPAVRRVERNMPWMEVKNISNTPENLTQFDLSIGDIRFNFSDDNFANFTVISPLSDIPVGDVTSQSTNGDDGIRLKFENGGLAPGEKVLFRIQLGVDAGETDILAQTSYPDYRTVLFDMNGIDAYDTSDPFAPGPLDDSDNAMFVGMFNNDPENITPTTAIPDSIVVGQQATIFNQYVRPQHTMEGFNVFGAETPAVPEPTSVVLTMLGLAAFGLVTGRRTSGRRQQTACSAIYRQKNKPSPSRQTACRHRQSRYAAR